MCGIFCLVSLGDHHSASSEVIVEALKQLNPRGPDAHKLQTRHFSKNGASVTVTLGFTRLAIMDTSDKGMQPFSSSDGSVMSVTNGEIYHFEKLAKKHSIRMETGCDCELIPPLCQTVGFENMIKTELDAEFATVVYDENTGRVYAARDRYGVRPLYVGFNRETKSIGFASELKSLHHLMDYVEQVRPSHYIELDLLELSEQTWTGLSTSRFPSLFIGKKEIQGISFRIYHDFSQMTADHSYNDIEVIKKRLRELFISAVEKRLHADRPIGFLLSGGLDSSLTVAIAAKILGPEKVVCFSIGMDGSPDVLAAKEVVQFLGITNHHIIPFTTKEALQALPEVIKTIETYDITTIRASTPQYLMAKYIREHSDVRVILSGEGSDEIHGSYRYFRDAPDPDSFHKETIRLLEELCYFDNQRTDRTMAGNGLEVRVPFLDHEYVAYITRISPKLLMYSPQWMEKQIIRDAFQGYLPNSVLYRSKEAFSDAVSSQEINWAETIKLTASSTISQEELETAPFSVNPPRTFDALYFRRIFEQFYPKRDNIIPHYWLPRWQNEEILDPSARVLKSY